MTRPVLWFQCSEWDVLSLKQAGIDVKMMILSVSLFSSYFLSAQVKLDGKSPDLFREFNYIQFNINILSVKAGKLQVLWLQFLLQFINMINSFH